MRGNFFCFYPSARRQGNPAHKTAHPAKNTQAKPLTQHFFTGRAVYLLTHCCKLVSIVKNKVFLTCLFNQLFYFWRNMKVDSNKNEHKEILQLIKEGREEGMKRLFEVYFDDLFRYCYNQIRNKEESEDILQTIFLDIWQNSNKRDIQDLKSYLYQMLKYQIYDYWANKKDISELVEEFNDLLSVDEVNQIIEANELEEALSEAVNQLPNACKEVFELSKYEALSHDEIASKLNISKQTVKNQLSKALKLIKEYLHVNKSLTTLELSALIPPSIFPYFK